MANPPVDSTHLSDLNRAEMIDQYGGKVDSQFAKKSIMRKFVDVQSVLGTDTLINRRIGKPDIQAITPGVRTPATTNTFGRASVTVDTTLLVRENRGLLNEFQTDFNARAKMGIEHGKEMAKFFDNAMLTAALKGSLAAAPTDQDAGNYNGAFNAGNNTTLASAGDELDPTALYEACAGIVTSMQLNDMDTDECALFVNPTQYDVLLNNDKLIDRDFSMDNGDFANGVWKSLKGVPVMTTNRMPQAVEAAHLLSNAGNGNAYNISATEARVVAQIVHPESVLAGETIPLQSDVFYDDVEKMWFIDTFAAYGAVFNLPEASGAVFHTV
tara:strand:- start:13 stop:993 length:981 start_codon:yes stop_codon:yes gene_type:complete